MGRGLNLGLGAVLQLDLGLGALLGLYLGLGTVLEIDSDKISPIFQNSLLPTHQGAGIIESSQTTLISIHIYRSIHNPVSPATTPFLVSFFLLSTQCALWPII